MPAFSKLLVANRGEIACRILRTAHAMGYRSVAVFSEADRAAPHVRLADEAVCIGPAAAAESYLSVAALLEAARKTGADALHPGYGFLSENAAFARACAEAGIVFVGPPPDAIDAMGDKARAKQRMRDAGVPTVPGFWGEASDDQLHTEAERIGFPLLVKATAGGGGRGIRVVRALHELSEALHSARAEALNAFGDGTLMLERFIAEGRHIEVQVFADAHGNAIHLGERDCTAQRRRQKVIEEAPSPSVDPALRERMGRDAVRAAQAVGYRGAGTVELIADRQGNYYFLEMNTRLQVEHPVTELVTGLDLVALQLRVASGEALPLTQADVTLRGHAIEARLYAEDPYAGFAPQTGRVLRFPTERALAIPRVRIDAGVEEGSVISPHYDAMVAKVIAHGDTRAEAVRRLCRALREAPLYGVRNNARFLIDLLQSDAFERAELHTALLDQWQAEQHPLLARVSPSNEAWALAAALHSPNTSALRSGSMRAHDLRLTCQGEERRLRVEHQPGVVRVRDAGIDTSLEILAQGEHQLVYRLEGVQRKLDYVREGARVHLSLDARMFVFEEPTPGARERSLLDPNQVLAPLAGKLLSVRVSEGDAVEEGAVLAVVEAMKMETKVLAGRAGRVRAVLCKAGAQVEAGERLFELADLEQT